MVQVNIVLNFKKKKKKKKRCISRYQRKTLFLVDVPVNWATVRNWWASELDTWTVTYQNIYCNKKVLRSILKAKMNSGLRGRNSSLVVFGLAVHSVAGSILLWGNFPIEGIFPLELTWVQTLFPENSFG